MATLNSFIALITALVVFLITTGILEFIFRILDKIAGQNFLLQEIWSSILAAILCSYLAMKCIEMLFSKYRRLFILSIYSAAHVAFLIWALYYMIPTAEKLGFGIKEFSIQVLTPVAAIITAFLTLSQPAIDKKLDDLDHGITDDDYE